MIFYELELLSIPKILFSYSVDVKKKKSTFNCIENFLELAVLEEGQSIHHNSDGTTEIVYPGMVSCIVSDMCCECTTPDGERQRHTTVGVNLQYRFQKYLSEQQCDVVALKRRMQEKPIILVPYRCPLDELYEKTLNTIKNISFLHLSGNPSDELKAIGKWYSLTGELTDFVLKKLDNIDRDSKPSEHSYAKKAEQYINMNYKKQLTVSEIAQHLEISEGYLHRIFKKVKGMGIVEYINQYRINVAIMLMENQNLSLKEAAYNVGIDDPAYMSRLFKKVTGMSFHDYLRQKSETVKLIDQK